MIDSDFVIRMPDRKEKAPVPRFAPVGTVVSPSYSPEEDRLCDHPVSVPCVRLENSNI